MQPEAKWFRATISALLVALLSTVFPSGSRAQQAVVAISQRITEKKVGDQNWTRAGQGAPLDANNRFRTGKRSKADLKFRDGSLLRLGQLSMVELRGAKNVQLLGGQLLFSMLKAGRVLAGGAAAAIKGSVGTIELRADGYAVFTLYSGAMDVITPLATVPVAPGTQVIVAPDGTISAPRRVAILPYAGGTLHPELVEAPVDAPFAGSSAHQLTLYDPARIALDNAVALSHVLQPGQTVQTALNGQDVYPTNQIQPLVPILNFYDPFGAPPAEHNTPAGTFSGTFGNGSYNITQVNGAPVNFPALAFPGFAGQNFTGTFTGNYVLAAPGQNAGQTVTFTQNDGTVSTLVTFADPVTGTSGYSYVTPGGQTLTGTFNPSQGPFVRFAPLRFAPLRVASLSLPLGRNGGASFSPGAGPTLFVQRHFGARGERRAQRETTPGDAAANATANATANTAANAPTNAPTNAPMDIPAGAPVTPEDGTPIDLNLAAAYRHIEQVSTSGGRSRRGDVTVSGAYTDGGVNVLSAFLHGAASHDRLFLDGTLRPLRGQANGSSADLSTISDLSLTLRDWRGEAQVGRQRFLHGPAQITLFGSLVRQGGREVMDAVRLAPDLGPQRKLELAYIYDAFPRNLPYRIGGAQGAWYGRFGVHQRAGNFGLNLLRYNNTPVPSTLGYSLDFAVPLKRNEIELYGEVGRDMFRRRLTTLGLAFPGLYDRSDYDLYLEYSNLGTGSAPTPPRELAARVYRRFNENLSGVLALSHFSHLDTKVTLGLAFGSSDSDFYGR
jgi:hypothetical protein